MTSFNMHFQMLVLTKSFATPTFVWFFACMNSIVSYQMALLCKSFFTYFALKGLYTRMCHLVSGQFC